MRRHVFAPMLVIIVLFLVSCGQIEQPMPDRDTAQDRHQSDKIPQLTDASQLSEPILRNTNDLKQKPSEHVYYRDQVIALMYHSVEVRSNRARVITAKQLDEQLTAIKMNGFRVITMNQYIDFILHKKPVPDNAVLLTFDDGYETFYRIVFPLLRKHGVTAANFVVVSWIDDPSHNRNPKLTWEQMREMKQAGIDFYNHTYNSHFYAAVDPIGIKRPRPVLAHRVFLNRLNRMETAQEYERRVSDDLTRAEKRLKEELGNTRSALAFPYGVYSYKVLKIARELGITVTFTVRPGINTHEDQNGLRINAGNQKVQTSKLIQLLKKRGKP